MIKFLNELKKRTFPTIIALSALSVSASAAFYSVTGLSKLFAGASFEVIIMAGSLEFAKLVIASLLYQYWSQLNRLLKVYLTTATFILILITSAGIYGFLSAAYQETATKSGLVDKEVEVYELKKNRYTEDRAYFLEEKSEIDKSIKSLRDGLANNVIQYKDRETGQIITTTSSSNRRALQAQLDGAITQRNEIAKKIEVTTDSINSLDMRVLDVKTESDLAGELGPLKYLSELTGSDMGSIINILLLIIIFVFDPLAIALVVAANFAFDKIKKDPKDESEEDELDEGPKPIVLTEEQLGKIEDSLINKESVTKEELVEDEFIGDDSDMEDTPPKWFEERLEETPNDEYEGLYWSEEEMYDFRNQFEEIEDFEEWDEEEPKEELKTEVEFDEDHALDMVMNDMVSDMTDEELKFEEDVIFEEEDEDLGDDTTYEEEELKEVAPPKIDKDNLSPFLRVGNRIIPRNNRYGG